MVNKRPYDAYFPDLLRRNDIMAPFLGGLLLPLHASVQREPRLCLHLPCSASACHRSCGLASHPACF